MIYKISLFFFYFFLIEVSLFFIVNILKKDFKWIVTSKDEKPSFEEKRLSNFYKKSFDKILGWDRKKNSTGYEFSDQKSHFNISKMGNRGVSRFSSNKISVFGDSFAFCRYVNDDETWENFLEKKIKSNVYNYGVGNYGIDQSFLKYIRYNKKLKNKIVIFNVVPETIARISSYWKHYREFGNIMAFKPVYLLKNHKLILKKNLLKKGLPQEKIYRILNEVKKYDFFYKKKFLKNIFKFPYIFSFLMNFKKNILLFNNLILYKFTKKKFFYNKALSKILQENIEQSHKMYKEVAHSKKLKSLLIMMNKKITKDKRKMILVISPQLLDFKSKYLIHSLEFYKSLSKEIMCIDISKYFANKKLEKYYFKDIYGGHFNKYGNKFVADIIFKYLKDKKLL